MPRRNKLHKFAELDQFPNVYQNFDVRIPILTAAHGKQVDLKGNWARTHFENEHPITLELACGRGEYSLALGAHFTERNFIGIDIKGARLWQGARNALDQNLKNVAFLRTRIEMLRAFFAPGEVAEIWITFPDPFPRESQINRRLTCPRFLSLFQHILEAPALVHLKTDDPDLYTYTLESVHNTPFAKLLYANEDIYAGDLYTPELAFKTYYEAQHLADLRTIKYVRIELGKDDH